MWDVASDKQSETQMSDLPFEIVVLCCVVLITNITCAMLSHFRYILNDFRVKSLKNPDEYLQTGLKEITHQIKTVIQNLDQTIHKMTLSRSGFFQH